MSLDISPIVTDGMKNSAKSIRERAALDPTQLDARLNEISFGGGIKKPESTNPLDAVNAATSKLQVAGPDKAGEVKDITADATKKRALAAFESMDKNFAALQKTNPGEANILRALQLV